MYFRTVLILILAAGLPWISWGISCCGGEGPRSFVALQELQTLDLSVTSWVQEVTGSYDPQGRVINQTGPSDLALLMNSVIRLQPNAEVFGRLPLVSRTYPSALGGETFSGLGDISVGVRLTVIRSLFVEDPFPTISLVAATKAPSGQSREGKGTGNGLWENTLGVSFRKEFWRWVGNVDATWTLLGGENQELNFTEGLSYEVTRKLYLGVGSNQMLSLGAPERSLSALGFGQLFLTQFTSLVGSFNWALPMDGLGRNQPITRATMLSLRYGFY